MPTPPQSPSPAQPANAGAPPIPGTPAGSSDDEAVPAFLKRPPDKRKPDEIARAADIAASAANKGKPDMKPGPKEQQVRDLKAHRTSDVSNISMGEMRGDDLRKPTQPALDPLEAAIRAEADELWRNWTPGKNAKGETLLSRPQLRSFIAQVRKGKKIAAQVANKAAAKAKANAQASTPAKPKADAKGDNPSKESIMSRKTATTTKSKARTAVKAAKTSKASGGERSRYDWAAAAEKAAKGTLPSAPDFSAPTHERFRPLLKEVVDAAKSGNLDALRKIKIKPISSSPKAVARYRDLCAAALKAKA